MSEKSVRFESPLEAFPGFVAFPEHLTGRLYRIYHKVLAEAGKEQEGEAPIPMGVVLEGEGEEKAPLFFTVTKWKLALRLAEKIELENLPAGALDEDGEETPVQVMAWVSSCLDEWMSPRLTLKK